MAGPRLNPDLLKVPLYIAGKSVDEVKEEYGLAEVIKLASNESPVGPSPRAVAAAECMLQEAHRYPGVTEKKLRERLAAHLSPELHAGQIVVGNGGTDVLRMITQAFVFDGGNTVMCGLTFPMYRILTTAFGGVPRLVPPTKDHHHDLAAMAEQIDEDTRLVFLCSPNNPTGALIHQKEADDFLARVPSHVVVVFDESYHDYVQDRDHVNSMAYVHEGRNVLLVRSFSKVAGLANLRIGYLIGPAELADYVRHAGLPFQTGDIALAAASASLEDRDYQEKHLQAVLQGRETLYQALKSMGLSTYPTQANFLVIIDPPVEVGLLTESLLRRGVIVRPMAAFGMPDGLRVTVGTPEENNRFIETLQLVLEEAR